MEGGAITTTKLQQWTYFRKYLVIDVLSWRGTACFQDVVIITMVNDKDAAWAHHTGNVLKSLFVNALVT